MKAEVDFDKEVVCIKCANNNFDAFQQVEKNGVYLYLVCSNCGWFLRLLKKPEENEKNE